MTRSFVNCIMVFAVFLLANNAYAQFIEMMMDPEDVNDTGRWVVVIMMVGGACAYAIDRIVYVVKWILRRRARRLKRN